MIADGQRRGERRAVLFVHNTRFEARITMLWEGELPRSTLSEVLCVHFVLLFQRLGLP